MYKGTYLEHMMGKTADPTAMLERLKRETIDAIDYEPTEVGAGTGLSFLLSLAHYANPQQIPLSGAYDEVMRRLVLLLYHLHTKVAMSEFAYPACCMTCATQNPLEEEPDNPDEWSDFVDEYGHAEDSPAQSIDVTDLDELERLAAEASAEATGSPADVLPAVQMFVAIRDRIKNVSTQNRFRTGNLANDLTEAIHQGLSKDLFDIRKQCPVVPHRVEEVTAPDDASFDSEKDEATWNNPDFEQWANWSTADWVRLEGWKRKVLSAAGADLSTMSIVISALQNVRENISRLGMARQVQVAMWATDLTDTLCTTLERSLAEICHGNVATRQGRAVLKDMLEPDGDISD